MTVSLWMPSAFCDSVTASRRRCLETADRENALFHFSCVFLILDTHRYQ